MTSEHRSDENVNKQKNPDVDNYISRLNTPLQEIAGQLRRIVHEAAPEINEKILFDHPWFIYNGRLCYMRSRRGSIHFGFPAGVDLIDPHKLLQGIGKTMRHITIDLPDRIPEDQIKAWIKEAVKLNEPKEVNLDELLKQSHTGDI
ncbi:MAG: DUF1801 domain-containing protein [Candidatus Hatepunaea meridiana]|nr:DUF1801 domain-containing protein [Candidatus Hatepunaea meridiana]